ncbi:hypothetical protein [uncultured Gammaproteobacteria bacterium]|nr:hypothetical protein [uncultured Gammaproteobacteria bacterium]
MQALTRQFKKVVKHNDLNNSKFYFVRKITCTVVDIALQKIRNQHDLSKGAVLPLRPHELSIVVTKPEIRRWLKGRDKNNGVISTRDLIKEDLDAHNFINYRDYQNPEWQQTETVFITNTEITEEGDLKIYFSVEFFEIITTKTNYTSQNISQQQSCKNLQSMKLYDLLRPSAKNERECRTSLEYFRFILNIKDKMSTGNLLAKARLLAEQITHETDISVTVEVEKLNKYGGASAISFFPTLKKRQTKTDISIRKRLLDYKISSCNIDKAPY